MDYLIVDRGNTRTKVALFNGTELFDVRSFDALSCNDLVLYLADRSIRSAIVSSSGSDPSDLTDIIRSCDIDRVVNFDHTTPIPLKNCYQTPSTLGVDRLATAVGAAELLPDKDLLIFDFGTAITIDYVSADGEFRGGNISPGLAMRFAALNHFTNRLPLVEAESGAWAKCGRSFGLSTHEAIYRGVVNGICYEIEGYINENSKKMIFFTGGDALFFEKQIKKAIFANSQATLWGLGVILVNICSND